MELFKWTDLIAATNLIVAAVAVTVALLSPRIAWKLTRRSQREDDKRRTKLNIFGALMENRHALQSREAVRALNLIDVAFHDNPEVRRIWREYHGMISNGAFFQSSVGIELTRQKLTELQAAMARDLGYAIDQFDVDRTYAPNWLREEEDLHIKERQARLAALKAAGPMTQTGSASAPGLKSGGALYLVRYTGQTGGQGIATIYFGNGVISGSDVAGGKYTGTYTTDGQRLRVIGKLDVPGGAQLVTGMTTDAPMSLPFSAELPLDFAAGQQHTVLLLDQPVLASFEKLQDI